MKRRWRLGAILAGAATLLVVQWVLVPVPFARGVIVGVVGALALVAGGFLAFARTMQRRVLGDLKPPALPVESWDYRWAATALDGTPLRFEDCAGRVLVVNLWATWCAPCVAEMPGLARLLAATADAGVAMACLTPEAPEKVRTFVAKRGLAAPIYLYEGEAPECFRTRSIPATFVLDKRGRIAMRHLGSARWDDPSVVAFVRGLAATPG